MNYKAQKAALTRATNSHDPAKVIAACRKVKAEWNGPNGYWPDDWSAWQRALDDTLGIFHSVSLDEL